MEWAENEEAQNTTEYEAESRGVGPGYGVALKNQCEIAPLPPKGAKVSSRRSPG